MVPVPTNPKKRSLAVNVKLPRSSVPEVPESWPRYTFPAVTFCERFTVADASAPAGVVLPTNALSPVPGTTLPLQVPGDDQLPETMTAVSAAEAWPTQTVTAERVRTR